MCCDLRLYKGLLGEGRPGEAGGHGGGVARWCGHRRLWAEEDGSWSREGWGRHEHALTSLGLVRSAVAGSEAAARWLRGQGRPARGGVCGRKVEDDVVSLKMTL